jgi:hypothetical protein
MFRPGAPDMAQAQAIRDVVARVVSGVIAARHARELGKEGAPPVAAGRARCGVGEVLKSHRPGAVHAPLSPERMT